MLQPSQSELLEPKEGTLSIIIPTYNESQNIVRMLDSIKEEVPSNVETEVIIVDDNSPDGTGEIVARIADHSNYSQMRITVISRPGKQGLSSAIMSGVRASSGAVVLVMDGDFSHPPETIPHMIEELQHSECDVVVASRYVSGGSIKGWPFKRKLLSRSATKIAQVGLGIGIKDPMSGFFAFRRKIINDIEFDAIGYKMLLEILVKVKRVRVKEIPYTFTNRRLGASKVDAQVIYDYVRAVYRLYRFGKSSSTVERRKSVRFLSKAGRFYTVGASGLVVNFAVSSLLGTMTPLLWYIHGTTVGILLSIISNFFLNKVWTFEDRNFSPRRTAIQLGTFLGFSSIGALIQLSIVYGLMEGGYAEYPLALVAGVVIASVGNFLLNKKWTFKEKIWS